MKKSLSKNILDLKKLKTEDIMSILGKVISKNVNYFVEGAEVELNVCLEEDLIDIETNNIFDTISDKAAISLKLIHNISMLYLFYENELSKEYNHDKNSLSKDNYYYLKFEVLTENINVLKRKGFGVFNYNIDDMINVLEKVSVGYERYLLKKIKEEKKLDYLNSVYLFVKNGKHKQNVDIAMITFIYENIELFKKYL